MPQQRPEAIFTSNARLIEVRISSAVTGIRYDALLSINGFAENLGFAKNGGHQRRTEPLAQACDKVRHGRGQFACEHGLATGLLALEQTCLQLAFVSFLFQGRVKQATCRRFVPFFQA